MDTLNKIELLCTVRLWALVGTLLLVCTVIATGAPVVHLKASNGMYVSVRGGGNGAVAAVAGATLSWESLDVRDLNAGVLHSDDVVSFKSSGGYYLCAEGMGGGVLSANRVGEGVWERFTLVKLNGTGAIGSGDQVAVKSANGRYLTLGADNIVDVTGSAIGPAQTFLLSVAGRPQTFANPVNLAYTSEANGARNGADPQIVPFRGRYYLFASCFPGMPRGYYVSNDLVDWSFIAFSPATCVAILANGTNPPAVEIVAPGAFTDGNHIYFARSNATTIVRTNTPDSGDWQTYATGANARYDVGFFYENGRLFDLYGGNSTEMFECDPLTFKEKPGTRQRLTAPMTTPTDLARSPYGLHMGQKEYKPGNEPWRTNWNLVESLDTTRLLPIFDSYATFADLSAEEQARWKSEGKYSMDASTEGAWVTKNPANNKYYLENSGPGTYCPWYNESVYTATSITGPYTLENYATSSLKVGGFANGAAHGGTFQDFSGNWWRICTIWADSWRRFGLFPIGFDPQGRLFTQTYQGDYPIILPQTLNTPSTKSLLAGWQVLSKGRVCTASSTLSGRNVSQATDENIYTSWSAATGGTNEWFMMDLGLVHTVEAVQVNFAEQDVTPTAAAEDYHAYRLRVSLDGNNWTLLSDKSANTTAVAHDYTAFSAPVQARYLKIENVHMAKRGKFALRDLRVFGRGTASLPPPVANFTAKRRASDTRHVTFTWTPVSGAKGYIINYGVAADALHLPIQYQNPGAGQLTVSCLNRNNARYFYRIDSYNENGVTRGGVISDP
jgi:hypothetical protein